MVVQQGIRVVGVSVETKQFKMNFLQVVVSGEPVKRVRSLVPTMKNVQVRF